MWKSQDKEDIVLVEFLPFAFLVLSNLSRFCCTVHDLNLTIKD